MYGVARSHYHFRATEGCVEFAFENSECLLEIVPVRRRAPPGGICISINLSYARLRLAA
jgi:hypothetical protein